MGRIGVGGMGAACTKVASEFLLCRRLCSITAVCREGRGRGREGQGKAVGRGTTG